MIATAFRVNRVRDADGASCPECGSVFGTLWPENRWWSWRKSQAMHERGTGHKMVLIRLEVTS